jgi:MGT family glycosyltransferase
MTPAAICAQVPLKKLIIVNFDARGHVNPTLPLTQELVRRGLEVLYLLPERLRASVESTGARVMPIRSIFMDRARADRVSPGELDAGLPLHVLEEAEHVLPQILPVLEREAPDGLAYDDMCMAGRYAAQLLGVPAAMFRTSYVRHPLLAETRQRAAGLDEPPQRQQFSLKMAALARRFGLREEGVHEFFAHAEPLNIVFMPRAFHPLGEIYDRRYVFVGAQIPASAQRTSHALLSEPPLIYISLGTVFNDRPRFLATCFEAFACEPCRVLVAAGEKMAVPSGRAVPANFRIERYVSQLGVLPETKVFVTHGGMNSVQEAIWYGVPMVFVPQMLEQAQTARRAATMGLGRALFARDAITPAQLSGAVAYVAADPGYRDRVRAMGEQSRAAGGYERAADLLQAHLGRHPGGALPQDAAARTGAPCNARRYS